MMYNNHENHDNGNIFQMFERLFKCLFAGSACMGNDRDTLDDGIFLETPVAPAAWGEPGQPPVYYTDPLGLGDESKQVYTNESTPELIINEPQPAADIEISNIEPNIHADADDQACQSDIPEPDNDNGWHLVLNLKNGRTIEFTPLTFSKPASDDDWVNISPATSPKRPSAPMELDTHSSGSNIRHRHTQ